MPEANTKIYTEQAVLVGLTTANQNEERAARTDVPSVCY